MRWKPDGLRQSRNKIAHGRPHPLREIPRDRDRLNFCLWTENSLKAKIDIDKKSYGETKQKLTSFRG